MMWGSIWTIAAKDLRESTAIGQVLAPVAIVPFVFVVLYPVGLLLALRSMSASDAQELIARIPASAFPGTGELTVQGRAAYIATVYLFAGFFLIIPTIVAVVLAANSFAGEKERHTLEGVLYTPVSDTALVVGKVVGAVVPAVAPSPKPSEAGRDRR
jgi:ABC-2 type transport system permease protein